MPSFVPRSAATAAFSFVPKNASTKGTRLSGKRPRATLNTKKPRNDAEADAKTTASQNSIFNSRRVIRDWLTVLAECIDKLLRYRLPMIRISGDSHADPFDGMKMLRELEYVGAVFEEANN